VNRDESQESLATQAAAWVPPWERERPEPERAAAPEPAEPESEPAPEAERAALPEPRPLPEPEPLTDEEPEPQAELDASGEPDLEADEAAEDVEDVEDVEPDGNLEEAAGTPELEERPEDEDDVEVTVDTRAPEPQPAEADVAEPEGEELSAEAAGTPAEEVGEEAPEPAVEAEPDGAVADDIATEDVAAEDIATEDVAAEDIAAEDGAVDDGTGQLMLEGLAPPPGELPAGQLRAALEAILLVVDEPVAENLLAQALDQPTARITVALGQLAAEYEGEDRGFELRRAAGGWRLYTRSRYAGYVERFVLDGQSVRLTQAALETLAVVAYKQPVTRSRISAIRGVNCDGVIRTLVTRGLIEECGSEPETGAHLYQTTNLFLEKLGLDSVEQLPPLAPFLPDELDEIADAQR
jgi:segregation and condensation protein B